MLDNAITKLKDSIERQDSHSWYRFQEYPVVGALLSVPVGLVFGASAIYHLAKSVFASKEEFYVDLADKTCHEYHICCANDFSIIAANHLLNIFTLGFLNFAWIRGASLFHDPEHHHLTSDELDEFDKERAIKATGYCDMSGVIWDTLEVEVTAQEKKHEDFHVGYASPNPSSPYTTENLADID